MTDDIVARLRLYANASIDGGWASVFRADLNAAAEEIERLLEALRIEREERATRLRDRESRCDLTWHDAANEIERLREALRLEREECAACAIDRKETQRERDEARREVCEWVSLQTKRKPHEIAQNRGWDCYKKEYEQ